MLLMIISWTHDGYMYAKWHACSQLLRWAAQLIDNDTSVSCNECSWTFLLFFQIAQNAMPIIFFWVNRTMITIVARTELTSINSWNFVSDKLLRLSSKTYQQILNILCVDIYGKVNRLSVDFIQDFIYNISTGRLWIFDWISNAPSWMSTVGQFLTQHHVEYAWTCARTYFTK